MFKSLNKMAWSVFRQKKYWSLTFDFKNHLLFLYILLFPIIGVCQCPPTSPTPFDGASDGPGVVSIFALDSDDDYRWYSDQIGGTLLQDGGEQFDTPFLTSTKIYYVCSYLRTFDCESPRVAVTATVNPAPGDPSVFGDGKWNVYCYNGVNFNPYSGYYVDNNFNINSSAMWDPMASPSQVIGYQGATVSNETHSVIYKKKNFPTGTYRIDMDFHDDYGYLYIDGVLIFGHEAHGHAHKNVWTGFLTNTSTVEFRWVDWSSFSIGRLSINPITTPTDLFAGTVVGEQTICKGEDPIELNSSQYILPIHDSYVRDGAFSTTIHDATDPTKLGTRILPNNNQLIYLTFDISALTSPVTSVKLRIVGFNTSVFTPNNYVRLHTVANTTWDENTLTYDNQPAYSTTHIDSAIMIDDGPTEYNWEITDFIQDELNAGRTKVSFMLRNDVVWDFINYFYSKEGIYPPMLVVNQPTGGCTFKKYQWQYSTGCTGTWQDEIGANSPEHTPSATQTTCYRLALTDICDNTVYSNEVTVTVAKPGSLSTLDSQFCYQPNSGIITLSGHTGAVTGWLTSLNNFTTSIPLVSTNTTESFNDLTATTSYKAIVVTGICSDTTNALTVIIDPLSKGGVLHLSDVRDDGGTITLKDYVGSIVRWESSLDSFKTFSTLNITTPDITFTNSTHGAVFYRAIVQSGSCVEVASDTLRVESMATYNTLTPNGDGINDTWIIDGIETYPENTVYIFNRWGDLVFSQESYDNEERVWKGNSNTGLMVDNNMLPEGSYFYQISAGNKKISTGYVVIKR
jgi:gliding motility-associated-like protein